MKIIFSNPCIRCGKERVVLKTWKEKIGSSIVIATETVCSNPECQKKVNIDNQRQRDKNNVMRLKNEQRALHRKSSKILSRV